MRKIGILGGTFDPVHWGHLSIAQTAATQFALDRVIWMPDRTPPHKSHSVFATFEQRREMVALATAERPDFGLLPLDTDPSAASSAIDNLLYLQNLHPEAQRYWIIGTDALLTLPKWPGCREIGRLCDWLVAPRIGRSGDGESGEMGDWENPRARQRQNLPGEELQKIYLQTDAVCRRVAQQMAPLDVQIRWQVVSMPSIEISSSQIRHCCAASRDLGYLVPEAVKTYIAAHQLYRA